MLSGQEPYHKMFFFITSPFKYAEQQTMAGSDVLQFL